MSDKKELKNTTAEKDNHNRVEQFLEEYNALCDKYGVMIALDSKLVIKQKPK